MAKDPCGKCGGTGAMRCNHCGGSGINYNSTLLDDECRGCHGTGAETCRGCHGSGEWNTLGLTASPPPVGQ